MSRAKCVCNSSLKGSGSKALLALLALAGALAWQASAQAAITYQATAGTDWNGNVANWTADGGATTVFPGSLLNGGALDDIVIIPSRSSNFNFDIDVDVGTIGSLRIGGGNSNRPQVRAVSGGRLVVTGDVTLGWVDGTSQRNGFLVAGNNNDGRITIQGDVVSGSTADNELTVNNNQIVEAGILLQGDIDPGQDPLGDHQIDLTINRGLFTWNGTTAYVEELNVVDIGNVSLVDTTWELKAGQTMIASARSDVGRNSSNASQAGTAVGTFNVNGAFTANAAGLTSFVIGSTNLDPTSGAAITKGAGTVNVGATGVLNVTGTMAFADAGIDDGNAGNPGGGQQIAQGTLNVNGGTVNANGGIRFGDVNDEVNAASASIINVNSGLMVVKGSMTRGANASTINLNGGTLWFDDASASNRDVTNFIMSDTAVLKMTFAGTSALKADSVNFGASEGATIDLEFPSLAANPFAQILWTGFSTSDWDDTASWDPEVLPSQGAGFLVNGQTYTLVETTGADILNIENVSLAPGDTLWSINTSDLTKVQATYSGTTQGFGPAAAVIGEYDGNVGDVDRAATLKIGNTVDPLYGPTDAARLIVQDTAFLTIDGPGPVEPNLIVVGNTDTDLPVDLTDGSTVANSADVNIVGTDSTINVSGNLIFGGGATLGDPTDPLFVAQPGGIVRLTGGILNVSGRIIEGLADGTIDPTVASAQIIIDDSGSVLNVTGDGDSNTPDIVVESYRVANAADVTVSQTLSASSDMLVNASIVAGATPGTFTISGGQLIVGNRGNGTLINNGKLTVINEILLANVDQQSATADASGTLTLNTGSITTVGSIAPDDGDPLTVEATLGGGIDLGNVANAGQTATLNVLGGELHVLAGGIESNEQAGTTTTINIGTTGGNPTVTLGEIGRGGGNNLWVADQGTGTFNMAGGSVFLNTNNFLVADESTSIGTASISGGTLDLRGVDGSRTDADLNVSNSGDGILNISGNAKIYVADLIQMSNNAAGADSQFNLSGGEVYVRNDFNTRTNGADIINISGGKLVFGQSSGTFAGTEQTNDLNFQTSGDRFNWTGGTIEGLNQVLGIANLADAGVGAGKFYQQGGTLAVTTGSTTFDGAYDVKAGATIEVNLVVGTEIGSLTSSAAIIGPSMVIDPTAEGDVNVDLTVVSTGNIEDVNAVTFDNGAGTATWDANATNWTNNVLPSSATLTVTGGKQWTLADTGATITGGTGGNTPLDSLNVAAGFTADLVDGAATDSDLVITLSNNVQVEAAVQAVIDGSVSSPVARTSNLRIDSGYNPEGAPIDAAALRIKNGATLNVSGITSPNLTVGGLGGGEVFHDDGTVNIDGGLFFDGAGGVYTLTSGALNVTGDFGDNPDSLSVSGSRFNFDGGVFNKYTAAQANGTPDTWAFVDNLGIATGASTSFDFVLNDGDAISGNLTAGTPGANAVYVGEFGAGTLTVGEDDGDQLDGATVTIAGGAADLFIGSQAGGSGVVTVNSGSTVTVADDIFIGQAVANDNADPTVEDITGGGTGTLTVKSGATVTAAGELRMGTGTVTVDGGTLTTTGNFVASDGPEDTSTVSFNSGTIDTGTMFIGDDARDEDGAEPFTFDQPGTGVATMNIGVGGGAPTVTVNALNVGQWSPATVTMDSGTLTVDNGNFNVVGRGVDGVGAPVGSTFTLNNGTLTVGDGVTARATIVGDTDNGNGTLNLKAGTVTLNGEVRIGDEFGGKGTVVIGQGGGAPTVVAGFTDQNTSVGEGGEGVFQLLSGTWYQNQGNFAMSQDADSKATVTIDGGTLDTTGQAGTATGQWNINYGTGFGIGNESVADILSGTVRVGGAMQLTNQTAAFSTVNIGDGTKAPTVLVGINLVRTGDTPNTDGINFRSNAGGLGGDTVNFKSGTLDLNGGDIDPGTARGTNAFNWTGGTLRNVRQFEGNLTQTSTDDPSKLVIGASVGKTTVDGNYSISGAQSSIEFQVEGTAGAGLAGGHDQLSVNGTATLGGTATILADPYAGPATRGTVETFALVGATTLSGTFASATYDGVAIATSFAFLNGTNGQFARMKYTSTEADLQAYFAQQGDLNGDLAVNNSDFGIFAANFNPAVGGKRWNQGDLNGDGFVNNSDFGIFAANFGWIYAGPLTLDESSFNVDAGSGGASLGELTAVPEPGTFALLGIAGLGLAGIAVRRIRRKR